MLHAAKPHYENGYIKEINGKICIYYDGYWIRYYAPPEDTLAEKKALIESLTRRAFHHTEPGINTPGEKLDIARETYETESDPRKKRVNGAMLAGALFNRAADIFTTIVQLAEKGVHIDLRNELMLECGDCFKEALDLGNSVKHYSGEEGIDELWGEPLKAFTMPMEQFYEQRYFKIAQTMRDIDRIARHVVKTLVPLPEFEGVGPIILELAEAAKMEAETVRSDWAIFEVWPRFVAASEALTEFEPTLPRTADDILKRRVADGMRLLKEGKNVLTYLAGARVPMRKTTGEFLDRCDYFTSNGKLPVEVSPEGTGI
jgi:hypothetical protein